MSAYYAPIPSATYYSVESDDGEFSRFAKKGNALKHLARELTVCNEVTIKKKIVSGLTINEINCKDVEGVEK